MQNENNAKSLNCFCFVQKTQTKDDFHDVLANFCIGPSRVSVSLCPIYEIPTQILYMSLSSRNK